MAKAKTKNEYATPDVDAKHLKKAEHYIQSNSEVAHPSHMLARIMAIEEKVFGSKSEAKPTAVKPAVVSK